MLELVPGCLFKFLTRDGNANTNKGACLWRPLIFFFFCFFLYSNSGLKIILSLFPASMNCNSELKKDKCAFACKVLFPLSFACTKFW